MSGLVMLFDVVREEYPEVKRLGEFTLDDIKSGLRKQGIKVKRSTLYAQLSGMGIERSRRGFYDAAQVAVLIGWYLGGDYSSYAQYISLAGQSIYNSVKSQEAA